MRASHALSQSRPTQGMHRSRAIGSRLRVRWSHIVRARLRIGLLVVAAVAVAGCGGTSGGPATGGPPPAGTITEFSAPNDPTQITAGPDGTLWFGENGHIGRITPAGKLTEFPLPPGENALGITEGPDGNLWFTDCVFDGSGDCTTSTIGRITPGGQISEFPDSNARERTIRHYQRTGWQSLVYRADGRQHWAHHPQRADHGVPGWRRT